MKQAVVNEVVQLENIYYRYSTRVWQSLALSQDGLSMEDSTVHVKQRGKHSRSYKSQVKHFGVSDRYMKNHIG